LYVGAQDVKLDVGFGLQPVLGLTCLLQCDSLLKNNRKPELCKLCREMFSFRLAGYRQVAEAIE
jgi:hypothetical protein